MPPKSKAAESDNKKRKISEVAGVPKDPPGTKKNDAPALKRPKTQYSNISYYPITTMPIGYPNTQEKPFLFSESESPYLIQLIKLRRDIGLYIFSWLEASTMARCQSVSKDFYQAQEGKEGKYISSLHIVTVLTTNVIVGFVEAAAKIAPKLREYRYSDVRGVQMSRGITVTQSLSVLEALVVPLLYLVGGYNCRRLQTQRTLKRFLPWLNVWKSLAPLKTPRRELGSCLVGNQLYAIGGVYGLNALKTAERYDPVKNVWQEVPKMRHSRRACTAVAMHQYIYVLGGFSLARSMNECERFCIFKQKWELIASMKQARSGCCSAVADGKVYVFGGGVNNAKDTDNKNVWAFNSGEKYDPKTDTWSKVSSMKHSRRGAMAATIGGKIYVRGGKNDQNEDVTQLECYDPKSDSWGEVDHVTPPENSDVFEKRLVIEFERADGVEMIDGIAASGCLVLTHDFQGSEISSKDDAVV